MSSSEYALKKGAILHSSRRDYVVDSVLGVGGFGITYKVSTKIKVENIYVKNQFAIKEHFLSDACERDHATGMVSISAPSRHKVEQSKIDFLAEANRLNGIKHPNIVAVNEVFEANDTAYYVMEYIDGKSLRHYIENNGVLDERQALAVMTPILNAVNYLHANRLTHLDIKPDNIMMRLDEESGELVPVLIDFGLSKHYDEKGRPTSTIRIQGCSNGYAPIEQYQGINSFSPTADVYALGATLYFLLKGKDPIISGELSREILERELPASLSDATRGALIHAMNLIKAERTQSVARFATELGVKIDNTATSVSAATLTQPIEKPKPDNSTEIINPNTPAPKRWVAPLLIGLGILVVGIITFFVMNRFGGGDVIDSADSTDSATVPSDTVAVPTELPVEVPIAPDVVDEAVDDGYSVAYAGALNLYNSRQYADCKRECQKLLRQYTSREQKQQLTQLIEYCDTALAAEQSAQQQSAQQSAPATSSDGSSSNLPDKAVDLGLSVLWADRNVGASSPSDYGGYYAWGETSTKSDYSWSSYQYFHDQDGNGQPYDSYWNTQANELTNIGSNIAGTRYDVARQKWGGGWKMTTKSQWQELIDNCTWTWTTQGGHSGYKVTSKKNGNSIFLPAAGYRNGASSNDVGSYGYYWSSTLYDSSTDDAWYLRFYSGYHRVNYSSRLYGRTVRPVCDK